MKKKCKAALYYYFVQTRGVTLLIISVIGMICFVRLSYGISKNVSSSGEWDIYEKVKSFWPFFIFLMPFVGSQWGLDASRFRKKNKEQRHDEEQDESTV